MKQYKRPQAISKPIDSNDKYFYSETVLEQDHESHADGREIVAAEGGEEKMGLPPKSARGIREVRQMAG